MPNNWITTARPMKSVLEVDEEFHRTYTSTFRVVTGHEASPLNVMFAGLPTYGSSYYWFGTFDLWAFCRTASSGEPSEDIEAIIGGQRRRAKVWFPTVTHTSRPTSGSNDPSQSYPGRGSPLDDPPVISGSFASSRLAVHTDKNGNPIVNTAGQPYSPPPEIDDSYDTLRISRNTANIDLQVRADSKGKVNSTSIWGLGPRQVKMQQWSYRIEKSGTSLTYVKNDWEFLISRYVTPSNVCLGTGGSVGFYTVLPNVGEKYIDDDGNVQRFTDKKDYALQYGNLDCNGNAASDQSSAPKSNVFAVEREYDFTGISGIPNPLPGPFV